MDCTRQYLNISCFDKVLLLNISALLDS
jgi:hypothetical protein